MGEPSDHLRVTEQFRIDVDGGAVSAIAYPPRDAQRRNVTFVFAHGAGAGQTHGLMVSYARAFAERGIETITFNFPYREHGRRLPDRAPILEACYAAVIDEVLRRAGRESRRLVIGGKSMGGRMATQLAARDEARAAALAGIVCLGYPLHPPGRPERLRTAHLPQIPCPVLIVQGSRDGLGTPAELQPIVEGLPQATLHVVDGGDHSFKVLKRSGRPQDTVHAAVQDEVVRWMVTLAGDSSTRVTAR